MDQSAPAAAVARGLSVVQGDADTDLADYPAASFDMVILSQTLQAMRRPLPVLDQLLRIGRSALVSFPNFGHWRVRAELLTRGRMPRTPALPSEWYDTANIHLCTVADFEDLLRRQRVRVEARRYLGRRRTVRWLANWRAQSAIYRISR